MKKHIVISLIITIIMILLVKYCSNLRSESMHDMHTLKNVFTDRDSIEIDIINATQDIKTINIVKLKECFLDEIYSEDDWIKIAEKSIEKSVNTRQ